jgi:MFS family permease
MIRNKYMVLGMTFMSLGLLGALISAIGASLPPIQKFFGVDISEVGSVTTYYQLSYAFFCFFGGLLTDFFGKNRVLALGGFLYGICTLALGMFGDFSSTLVLFTVIGIGGGLFFIGANTMIVQLFPDQRGKYLNLLHLCFAVGSVIASLMVSGLVSAGFKWTGYFRFWAPWPSRSEFSLSSPRPAPPPPLPAPVCSRGFWPNTSRCFGTQAVSVSSYFQYPGHRAQFGTIYLLVLFWSTVRGLPVPSASLVSGDFLRAPGDGRIIVSSLISKIRITTIVSFLLAFLFVALAGGWITRGLLSVILLALTGLACSGLMPSLIALASHLLPKEVTGLALGILSMLGALGGMGITKLVTRLAGTIGLEKAFSRIDRPLPGRPALFPGDPKNLRRR